jgi:hypothetical protein
MFFLNLSLGEFLTLLGVASGIVTALYLLDRAKRKKVVSTLRFWSPALSADQQQSRKRMREPWSLLLELLGILLLLLAVAQLQWGSRERAGRDHVLMLDTSAWSAERVGPAGRETVLDREKRLAERYINLLPANDRVLFARVDGLATPVTMFTSDHKQLNKALSGSRPQFSALNLEQALSFARQAQSWSGGRPGEVVYIGPKLITEAQVTLPKIPRLRAIAATADLENAGIRRIGVKRNEEDSNAWQATVTVKNYGTLRRTVRLKTKFAGTVFTPRILNLEPSQEVATEYGFVTNTSGQLIAEIEPGDNLPSDDRATVTLPRSGQLSIAVYTDRPDVLRPIFEANHRLSVQFFTPSQYVAKPAADVMLLDEIAPPEQPKISSLWIAPPREKSPLPIKSVINDATVKSWHSENQLGTGLHAKETRIPSAEVFETFEGDVPVASASEGPIVVARPTGQARPKIAVIGFDPLSGQLRYEVTTPLLFANLLRWLSPESFRTLDIVAGQVGTATVTLDPSEHTDRVRLVDERGFAVPFTVRNQTLQLFVSRPSTILVTSDDRERFLSLTLPDVAEHEWKPSPTVARGLPPAASLMPTSVDLWQWLAVLGGLVLFIEWMIFGRRRVLLWRKPVLPAQPRKAPERERELASK